ncbi:hypothetical protein VM1G_01370 [Cytospora mali]|uniref:Uncharacterized protein n=1 Tax=Cytospora mali TaxID=578113 RepID=A0A194VR21_CYTMA|nr:hypothetical protein VM1G_01370 [Valsa mali]
MDYYPDEASSTSLVSAADDDGTTFNDNDTETLASSRMEVTHCGMLEQCDCGNLSCQSRDLLNPSQLPATSKAIYESWTLTYHLPKTNTQKRTKILPCAWWLTVRTDVGHVTAVEPQTHFDQEELASAVRCTRKQYRSRKWFTSRKYDDEVEFRLRKLDREVQYELHKLLRDRTENASNSFRRREYKIAVLVEVPGGEMTDAASQKESWFDRLRNARMPTAPHVEYRVVLRGDEVRRNNAGWGFYDRYSQPWKLADEAELANVRGKDGDQEIRD